MFRVESSENLHECAIFGAGVLWGVKSDRNSHIENEPINPAGVVKMTNSTRSLSNKSPIPLKKQVQ